VTSIQSVFKCFRRWTGKCGQYPVCVWMF